MPVLALVMPTSDYLQEYLLTVPHCLCFPAPVVTPEDLTYLSHYDDDM